MRAVDLQPGDGEKALAELRLAGAFVDEHASPTGLVRGTARAEGH